MRRLTFMSSSAVAVALCTLLACGGSPQQGEEPSPQDPQSGGLEQGEPLPGEETSGGGEEANGNGGPANSAKVTICHIPPGNPANAHTITVGAPAVKAHIKHGDTLGACGGETDAGTGGETDAGTGGGETDAGTGGGEADAGTGGGDVDAGPPSCSPAGASCGNGVYCCQGLSCSPAETCEPIIG